jgi:hypothetical protein
MNIKNVTAKNGEDYTISIDDDGIEIIVSQGVDALGTIGLDYIQNDWPDRDHYYITRLALEKCAGIGLGRACLIFHKECFDAPITASDEHGQRSQDGSHLTGMGPGFIYKMRQEGLVAPSFSDRYDRDNEDHDE